MITVVIADVAITVRKSETTSRTLQNFDICILLCVMKLWLILEKNLSTLLSGCDRLLPPAALFSGSFKNRIRCNLFASTANLTLKTLTACTADTHDQLPNSIKLCNSNVSANRDNRLYILFYTHTHTAVHFKRLQNFSIQYQVLIPGTNTSS